MHPNIWYPYTQAKTAPDPIEVKSAQGLWLELADGRKIADCISSWWVNLHGHAHPQIVAAIARQAAQLEHVIFAGFTHAPAQELASQLVARLPEKLTRVFYSDNVSTAVEVAMKMAYQYWANVGEPRDRFLSFEGAYHGDMFGTMAVGARSIFSDVFKDLLFAVDFCPYPDTYDGDLDVLQKEANCLDKIRQNLSNDLTKTLYYGHSYTANPLGCAAALASLELLDRNQPVYTQMEIWHRQYLTELVAKYPQLTKLRIVGTIAAVDIVNHQKSGYLNEVGREIRHHAISYGVLLRPLGNVLYLMPPYCITESELGWIYSTFSSYEVQSDL